MTLPRIILLGANGQVGWELRRALLPVGEVIPLTRAQADLMDLDGLRQWLAAIRPEIIVNAAAYTAVDKAESEPALAYHLNVEVPKVLADYAAVHGAWLVHYSTDYVFDGTKTDPYTEEDVPNPRNVYGRTKRDGEVQIFSSKCRHVILRTSWVYAVHGQNFAKTILRLAAERESLRVVADQIGAPTSAEWIADCTAHILLRLLRDVALADTASGVYHLTAYGSTSWHGYAQFVITVAKRCGLSLCCTPDAVHPISTEEYPLPAVRPKNSRLDCRKLQSTFGLAQPPWQNQVERLIEELSP